MQKPDNSKLIIYFNGEPVEVTTNGAAPVIPKDLIQCTEKSSDIVLTLNVIGFQEWYYGDLEKNLYQ